MYSHQYFKRSASTSGVHVYVNNGAHGRAEVDNANCAGKVRVTT
jgi:hypothetical protein